MRYLMLHCIDETATFEPADDPDAPGSAAAQAMAAWVREMEGTGVKKYGGHLRPAGEAVTVRVRDGELLVSDGPFAETKEQIAGFDLLQCADLDAALEVAARHPTARIGTFELRPLVRP
ncbi:MAG TPA: YciI family protein [Streptosporangiaceae bacterium]